MDFGALPSDEFHYPTLLNSASRIKSPSQHGPCLVAAYPYLEVASGSIPLFLIASEARAEARNSISRLEPSISPEPTTTAAENTWTN
jgi:hypothetical protein